MDITQEYSELFSSLVALIRSSNSLYSLDVDFVRSINRDLAARSENASNNLLEIINELVANCDGANSNLDQQYRDAGDVLKRWKSIEYTFDLLSDKIDIPTRPQLKGSSPVDVAPPDRMKDYMRLSNNIAKPQLEFATKVDNSVRPFRPFLTQKPFATRLPLSQSLAPQPPDMSHAKEWYEQPYKLEIAESAYPEYKKPVSNERPQWDSTPFTFVDTPKKLFKMVSKLEKATEIAVDVEHHDYRSYLGLVCLLQVSGLGEDYVIDALSLRSELQILNRVFANPEIIKVFHGAKMDIMWLQRDLGVYVVGLFDTYFAARELEFPKLSLAYMLHEFAGFQAQKKYQLADWRMRPLPQELVDYARADTHFLLYIYHQLVQRLQETGKLQIVHEESRKVASYRYEYPGWNEIEPAWVQFAFKHRLNGQLQRAILVKLSEWRDKMARKYDESTRYVMGPQFLANLCVTKPSSSQGVLAASHHISPIARRNAERLAELIQDVCADPDSVDTTIPGLVAPPAELSDVGFAVSSLSIADLKCVESKFMGSSQPQLSPVSTMSVQLNVVTPEQMEQALTYSDGRPNKDSPAEYSAQVDNTKDAEALSQEMRDSGNDGSQPGDDTTMKSAISSGRKLNIVESADDVDLTVNVNKSRPASAEKDEAAFDFGSAPNVMQASQRPNNSFSQFKKKVNGPKGVSKNTSNFKNAKSLRR